MKTYRLVQLWDKLENKNRILISEVNSPAVTKVIYSTNTTGAPVPVSTAKNVGYLSSKPLASLVAHFTCTGMTQVQDEIFSSEDALIIEKFGEPEAKKETAKGELVAIEVPVNTEPKEFVPADEWFLDTGILEPIKAGIVGNRPVLLIGETGVGKTAVVRHLAAKTKNGFRRLNLNGSTTVDEFVGRWKLNKDREMVWIDGVLTEAMKKGLWLLCDEINACLPEISFVLHSVLDDDRYLVLSSKDNEIVKPHKDFRFFGAMNPNYSGTHNLNFALEDRFSIVVYVDYPTQGEEVKIISNKAKNDQTDILKKMVMIANKIRAEYKNERFSSPMSTRKLIDWAMFEKTFGVAKAFQYTILNKLSGQDKTTARDIAATIFTDPAFNKELVI